MTNKRCPFSSRMYRPSWMRFLKVWESKPCSGGVCGIWDTSRSCCGLIQRAPVRMSRIHRAPDVYILDEMQEPEVTND